MQQTLNQQKVDRRRFLKGSAVAAASGTSVGGAALLRAGSNPGSQQAAKAVTRFVSHPRINIFGKMRPGNNVGILPGG